MKTKILCLFAALSVFSAAATAEAVSPADYADRFKVDMNERIPPIEELRKMFAPKPVYDRKFDYFWNIGTVFDKGFAKTIRQYGTRQTRLKWPGEDIMLEQLKNTPKEYYQYIGPYLHTGALLDREVFDQGVGEQQEYTDNGNRHHQKTDDAVLPYVVYATGH